MLVLAPHLHQAVKFFLDFLFVHGGIGNGNARVVVALDVDFGVNFDFEGQCDAGFLVVFELGDLELADRDNVRVLERLAHNLVDGLVHGLVTDGVTELLQDHRLRDHALAETLQGHLLLVLGKLLFEGGIEIRLRDCDFEGAHGCACFFDFNGHYGLRYAV